MKIIVPAIFIILLVSGCTTNQNEYEINAEDFDFSAEWGITLLDQGRMIEISINCEKELTFGSLYIDNELTDSRIACYKDDVAVKKIFYPDDRHAHDLRICFQGVWPSIEANPITVEEQCKDGYISQFNGNDLGESCNYIDIGERMISTCYFPYRCNDDNICVI